MSSPTAQQRLSGLNKPGASSCPTSPLQRAKPDRSADFAAVRNLAESYGVDLLPLEMGFTPLRTQVKSADKSAQRLSTADSSTDHPNTPEVGETATAAGRGLEQTYSAGSTASAGHEAASAGRLLSPGKASNLASTAADQQLGTAQQLQASAMGSALGCYPIDVDDGSNLDTESPSGFAEFADEGQGECLYFEEQLPVEERVTLLEEERDMLVDKLLATTEALHASEARNRQSEASQNQVHALLEQLQELLRRAEVERDRAKMQLKRHRASNSQFLFPALGASAQSVSPVLQAEAFTIGSLGGAGSTGVEGLQAGLAARPRSKKYKVSSKGGQPSGAGAGASGLDGTSTGSQELPATASEEGKVPGADVTGAAAVPGSADGSSTGASATTPAAKLQGAPAGATAEQAPEGAADSSVAAVGSWGSRRDSNASSCDSSDAASPGGSPEQLVTLTPSTDDARPPVSSVVRGFEALLHRQRTQTGSPAGSTGGRSRDLVSARSSASGSGSRSASPMASRGRGESTTVPTMPCAAPAGDVPVAQKAKVVRAVLEQPAAAAEAVESPADSPAAGATESESTGLSPTPNEVFRRTYADAAVAGAEAECSRRSAAGLRAQSSARTTGLGSSSSAASTPTAAKLCNTAPVGSYMLDSSCFSEEEEVVSGGGAVVHSGLRASGQGVYDPTRYTPPRTDSNASTGGQGEWLPGGKRGRSNSSSSSPAVTPTAQQQPAASQATPGSAFGSVISLGDSPAGSVTQGAGSSPAGGSNGGSSRSKPRSASRLGLAPSPAGSAPVDLNPNPSASSSKQGQKSKKGQGQQQQQQQRGSAAGAAVSSGGSSGNVGVKKQSPRHSVDGTAEVAVSPAAGKAQKSSAGTAAAGCSKPTGKKPSAAAEQQTAASMGSASRTSNSRSSSMLLVAVMLALCAVAVAVYMWSQFRLAAMQQQVQQLQKQLSERSAECPSDLDLGAVTDREL